VLTIVLVAAGSLTVDMELEDPNDDTNEDQTMRIILVLLFLSPLVIYTVVKSI